MIHHHSRSEDHVQEPVPAPPTHAERRVSIRLQSVFRLIRRLWNRSFSPEALALPAAEIGCLDLADSLSVSLHDHGVVVLDSSSGLIFVSNRIGARIWKSLEQRASLDVIVSDVSREYRIDRARALKDTCRFLADLQHRGLLKAGVSR